MVELTYIAVCLVIGMALARTKKATDQLPSILATFAIYVSLPALVLKHLHSLPFESGVLLPSLMPFIVFFLAASFAILIGRFLSLSKPTVGCLILVCGTGNTSIVGIPLVQAFVGQDATGYAVVADQANFIVMAVLGLVTANVYSANEDENQSVVHQIVTYPPAIAMLAALVLRPFEFPFLVESILQMLGSTLTPLAIVSIGAGMRLSHLSGRVDLFAAGIAMKLVIAPALIFFLYSFFRNGFDEMAFSVSVIQAGMPPMIVAGLIAVDRKLDPPLAMMLISFSIPLFFPYYLPLEYG